MKKYLTLCCIAMLALAACQKQPGAPRGPVIVNFTPAKGYAGIMVTINGYNFDSVASHVSVSFNGVNATVYASTDSVIRVLVPAGATTGKITVAINGNSTSSANDFEILSGEWIKDAGLPAAFSKRTNAAGIAVNDKGYMGFGEKDGIELPDWWQYDPATNNWVQKASLGTGFQLPVCMAINNKIYVGLGISFKSGLGNNLFYEYDPALDKWTRKADFPGDPRRGAFGVGLGSKGYVGFGNILPSNSWENSTVGNDWYEYDPVADKWTKKADATAAFTWPSGFALNGKIYVAGISGNNKLLLAYNPATNSWEKKNDFPGNLDFQCTGVVNSGKGYLIGNSAYWQYTDAADTWVQKAFFADRISGAGFTAGNKIYYGTGFNDYEGDHDDFWEFELK